MKIETDLLGRKSVFPTANDKVQINSFCKEYENEFGTIARISDPISLFEENKYFIYLDNGKEIIVSYDQFDLCETSEYYTLIKLCR